MLFKINTLLYIKIIIGSLSMYFYRKYKFEKTLKYTHKSQTPTLYQEILVIYYFFNFISIVHFGVKWL